jgi:hypothetical protein
VKLLLMVVTLLVRTEHLYTMVPVPYVFTVEETTVVQLTGGVRSLPPTKSSVT